MGERTEYQPGTFCWPELGTSDAQGAKAFYGELMGWHANDLAMESGGAYTMWQLQGKDIGAMYELMEDQVKQGVAPNWMCYVSVDDLDAYVTKVNSLNGTVMMGPYDIGDAGRMAVIQDPQGATFALWQGNKNIGAQIVNEPGTLCWNELATSDLKAAESFYCTLFGWSAETQKLSMGNYTSFKNHNTPVGGMMQMTEEWGDIPPHWMTYFSAADVDKQCEKVKSLGGTVCVEPFDVPEVGRLTIINDPQGAVFSLIQLNSSAP